MICCLIGTRAQLIKMAPVIRALQSIGLESEILFTGQHKETMQTLMEDFGLQINTRSLYQGEEVSGIFKMIRWFFSLLISTTLRNPLKNGTSIVLVHGDTLSTLLGAIIAKRHGVPVGHIESGLRSFNLFHPFPEEITRLLVFRLTDIAYCPGTWAIENMAGFKMERVNTHGNTLLDALRIACDRPGIPREGDFGICSIHRFENIFDKNRLTFIVDEVIKATKFAQIIFVLHPATRNQLTKFDLLEKLQKNPHIELAPRMGYMPFVSLLRQSKFVITDGGGNQEELSYLKKPTILMRKTTERQEGLGDSVVISKYDPQIIENALKRATSGTDSASLPEESPSLIIAEHLKNFVSRH